jgi:hypothetical protein
MKKFIAVCFLLSVAQLTLAQQFRLSLLATDGVNSKPLTFGIHPAGTNGYDSGLDTLAPPSPPAGSFDARLRYPELGGSEDYFVDIRSNVAAPDTFYVHYAPATGSSVVTISWDAAQFGTLANTFIITDNINGALFSMDMKSRQRIRSDTASGLVTSSFRLIITPPFVPVQLASFIGRVINQDGHVRLDWRTISETNNYGFFVQKSQSSTAGFSDISDLIPGNGTTLEPHDYTWTDVHTSSGTWYYRLKQVDLSNAVHYTDPIAMIPSTGVRSQALPSEFGLKQNFPNPFNPTTVIEYALPKQSHVKIDIYNILGQPLATLLDAVRPAGYHTVTFNGQGYSSGMYFYRLKTEGKQVFLKKMILMK